MKLFLLMMSDLNEAIVRKEKLQMSRLKIRALNCPLLKPSEGVIKNLFSSESVTGNYSP